MKMLMQKPERRKGADTATAQPETLVRKQPRSDGIAPAIAKRHIRILVVEDRQECVTKIKNGINTKITRHFPEQQEMGVLDVAMTLETARELIAKNAYDLVFLDHLLPENEEMAGRREFQARGYELVGAIKEKNRAAFVIGTSSFGDMIRSYPRPDISLDKNRFCSGDVGEILGIVKQIVG